MAPTDTIEADRLAQDERAGGGEQELPDIMGSEITNPTVVVKIGSAVIAPGGKLSLHTIHRFAAEIAELHHKGVRVVIVSSGAVACGMEGLGLKRMPEKLSDRQAAAAMGQPIVMRAWTDALEWHDLTAAQVLLTADDIDFRARFVNANRKLATLLETGAIPIINENDAVAFSDVTLGDNDRVGTLVSGLVEADLLVMLSSADGLRSRAGKGDILPIVERLEDAITHVHDSKSDVGTGGMRPKLEAAFTARQMGTTAVIASGNEHGVLGRVLAGERVGTVFPADETGHFSAASRRKQWIAHAIRVKGTLVVDRGAHDAIVQRGASLLPKGIIGVRTLDRDGFRIGSAVEIRTEDGPVFARGLVSYRHDEIQRIMGRRSEEIEPTLGYAYSPEVIHRDDLVIMPTPPAG
jgi:glutamate 5-kinase